MTSLQKSNSKLWKADLNDREFKVAVMKKVNKTRENSERQFNELRNEKKEYFTKEIETIKKKQTEVLELINEMKNALESIGNIE